MLICTARLSRKKLVFAVIICGLALMALIFFLGKEPAAEDAPLLLSSNEERVAYLESLGWEVAPEPLETLQFLLPSQLSGSYLAYNELQNTQGFDLTKVCGKQLTRFTYAVANYPGRSEDVQLNLYLCEDRIVAGDICCIGPDGFQGPLVYPQQNAA